MEDISNSSNKIQKVIREFEENNGYSNLEVLNKDIDENKPNNGSSVGISDFRNNTKMYIPGIYNYVEKAFIYFLEEEHCISDIIRKESGHINYSLGGRDNTGSSMIIGENGDYKTRNNYGSTSLQKSPNIVLEKFEDYDPSTSEMVSGNEEFSVLGQQTSMGSNTSFLGEGASNLSLGNKNHVNQNKSTNSGYSVEEIINKMLFSSAKDKNMGFYLFDMPLTHRLFLDVLEKIYQPQPLPSIEILNIIYGDGIIEHGRNFNTIISTNEEENGEGSSKSISSIITDLYSAYPFKNEEQKQQNYYIMNMSEILSYKYYLKRFKYNVSFDELIKYIVLTIFARLSEPRIPNILEIPFNIKIPSQAKAIITEIDHIFTSFGPCGTIPYEVLTDGTTEFGMNARNNSSSTTNISGFTFSDLQSDSMIESFIENTQESSALTGDIDEISHISSLIESSELSNRQGESSSSYIDSGSLSSSITFGDESSADHNREKEEKSGGILTLFKHHSSNRINLTAYCLFNTFGCPDKTCTHSIEILEAWTTFCLKFEVFASNSMFLKIISPKNYIISSMLKSIIKLWSRAQTNVCFHMNRGLSDSFAIETRIVMNGDNEYLDNDNHHPYMPGNIQSTISHSRKVHKNGVATQLTAMRRPKTILNICHIYDTNDVESFLSRFDRLRTNPLTSNPETLSLLSNKIINIFVSDKKDIVDGILPFNIPSITVPMVDIEALVIFLLSEWKQRRPYRKLSEKKMCDYNIMNQANQLGRELIFTLILTPIMSITTILRRYLRNINTLCSFVTQMIRMTTAFSDALIIGINPMALQHLTQIQANTFCIYAFFWTLISYYPYRYQFNDAKRDDTSSSTSNTGRKWEEATSVVVKFERSRIPGLEDNNRSSETASFMPKTKTNTSNVEDDNRHYKINNERKKIKPKKTPKTQRLKNNDVLKDEVKETQFSVSELRSKKDLKDRKTTAFDEYLVPFIGLKVEVQRTIPSVFPLNDSPLYWFPTFYDVEQSSIDVLLLSWADVAIKMFLYDEDANNVIWNTNTSRNEAGESEDGQMVSGDREHGPAKANNKIIEKDARGVGSTTVPRKVRNKNGLSKETGLQKTSVCDLSVDGNGNSKGSLTSIKSPKSKRDSKILSDLQNQPTQSRGESYNIRGAHNSNKGTSETGFNLINTVNVPEEAVELAPYLVNSLFFIHENLNILFPSTSGVANLGYLLLNNILLLFSKQYNKDMKTKYNTPDLWRVLKFSPDLHLVMLALLINPKVNFAAFDVMARKDYNISYSLLDLSETVHTSTNNSDKNIGKEKDISVQKTIKSAKDGDEGDLVEPNNPNININSQDDGDNVAPLDHSDSVLSFHLKEEGNEKEVKVDENENIQDRSGLTTISDGISPNNEAKTHHELNSTSLTESNPVDEYLTNHYNSVFEPLLNDISYNSIKSTISKFNDSGNDVKKGMKIRDKKKSHSSSKNEHKASTGTETLELCVCQPSIAQVIYHFDIFGKFPNTFVMKSCEKLVSSIKFRNMFNMRQYPLGEGGFIPNIRTTTLLFLPPELSSESNLSTLLINRISMMPPFPKSCLIRYIELMFEERLRVYKDINEDFMDINSCLDTVQTLIGMCNSRCTKPLYGPDEIIGLFAKFKSLLGPDVLGDTSKMVYTFYIACCLTLTYHPLIPIDFREELRRQIILKVIIQHLKYPDDLIDDFNNKKLIIDPNKNFVSLLSPYRDCLEEIGHSLRSVRAMRQRTHDDGIISVGKMSYPLSSNLTDAADGITPDFFDEQIPLIVTNDNLKDYFNTALPILISNPSFSYSPHFNSVKYILNVEVILSQRLFSPFVNVRSVGNLSKDSFCKSTEVVYNPRNAIIIAPEHICLFQCLQFLSTKLTQYFPIRFDVSINGGYGSAIFPLLKTVLDCYIFIANSGRDAVLYIGEPTSITESLFPILEDLVKYSYSPSLMSIMNQEQSERFRTYLQISELMKECKNTTHNLSTILKETGILDHLLVVVHISERPNSFKAWRRYSEEFAHSSYFLDLSFKLTVNDVHESIEITRSLMTTATKATIDDDMKELAGGSNVAITMDDIFLELPYDVDAISLKESDIDAKHFHSFDNILESFPSLFASNRRVKLSAIEKECILNVVIPQVTMLAATRVIFNCLEVNNENMNNRSGGDFLLYKDTFFRNIIQQAYNSLEDLNFNTKLITKVEKILSVIEKNQIKQQQTIATFSNNTSVLERTLLGIMNSHSQLSESEKVLENNKKMIEQCKEEIKKLEIKEKELDEQASKYSSLLDISDPEKWLGKLEKHDYERNNATDMFLLPLIYVVSGKIPSEISRNYLKTLFNNSDVVLLKLKMFLKAPRLSEALKGLYSRFCGEFQVKGLVPVLVEEETDVLSKLKLGRLGTGVNRCFSSLSYDVLLPISGLLPLALVVLHRIYVSLAKVEISKDLDTSRFILEQYKNEQKTITKSINNTQSRINEESKGYYQLEESHRIANSHKIKYESKFKISNDIYILLTRFRDMLTTQMSKVRDSEMYILSNTLIEITWATLISSERNQSDSIKQKSLILERILTQNGINIDKTLSMHLKKPIYNSSIINNALLKEDEMNTSYLLLSKILGQKKHINLFSRLFSSFKSFHLEILERILRRMHHRDYTYMLDEPSELSEINFINTLLMTHSATFAFIENQFENNNVKFPFVRYSADISACELFEQCVDAVMTTQNDLFRCLGQKGGSIMLDGSTKIVVPASYNELYYRIFLNIVVEEEKDIMTMKYLFDNFNVIRGNKSERVDNYVVDHDEMYIYKIETLEGRVCTLKSFFPIYLNYIVDSRKVLRGLDLNDIKSISRSTKQTNINKQGEVRSKDIIVSVDERMINNMTQIGKSRLLFSDVAKYIIQNTEKSLSFDSEFLELLNEWYVSISDEHENKRN